MLTVSDIEKRYPVLRNITNEIQAARDILINCFESGGKLLVAGNGGSMSDSLHITGELMKSFAAKRKIREDVKNNLTRYADAGEYLGAYLEGALPVIALENAALSTAAANDTGRGDLSFAQMVYGLGKSGDVFWSVSTSGNSENIYLAAITAKSCGLKVIGLTGRDGGKLKSLCDVCVCVPETETHKIQELHLPVYHAICLEVEHRFWG